MLLDFFRVVTVVGVAKHQVVEESIVRSLAEVAVVVLLAVAVAVFVRLGPVVVLKGGIVATMRELRVTARHAETNQHRSSKQKEALPKAIQPISESESAGVAKAATSSPPPACSEAEEDTREGLAGLADLRNAAAEIEQQPQKPVVALQSHPKEVHVSHHEPSTTHHKDGSHSHHNGHVDLDALLDEFCGEEDLMDEAFVDSIVEKSKSHDTTKEKKGKHEEKKAPATISKVKPADAKTASDRDAEAALAKKMMAAFAEKPQGSAAKPASTTAPSKPHPHTAQPKAPSAASLASKQAPASTPAKGISVKKSNEVNLDDVFDEMQKDEDAIQEALLDQMMEAAHAEMKSKAKSK